jgi:hypothetical protein
MADSLIANRTYEPFSSFVPQIQSDRNSENSGKLMNEWDVDEKSVGKEYRLHRQVGPLRDKNIEEEVKKLD